jgi:hypothetical protein
VTAVPKRKLNNTVSVPGTTLVAPVPAWMFEICQVVGGKYSLPGVPLRSREVGQRGRPPDESDCA